MIQLYCILRHYFFGYFRRLRLMKSYCLLHTGSIWTFLQEWKDRKLKYFFSTFSYFQLFSVFCAPPKFSKISQIKADCMQAQIFGISYLLFSLCPTLIQEIIIVFGLLILSLLIFICLTPPGRNLLLLIVSIKCVLT